MTAIARLEIILGSGELAAAWLLGCSIASYWMRAKSLKARVAQQLAEQRRWAEYKAPAELRKELEECAQHAPLTDCAYRARARILTDRLRRNVPVPDLALAAVTVELLRSADQFEAHALRMGLDPFEVMTETMIVAVADLSALERELAS